MLKKILYAIVIIAVIVILAIMWTDSKNKKSEVLPENQTVSTETQTDTIIKADTSASMSDELDNVDVNSGIDTDITSMDTSIKSL